MKLESKVALITGGTSGIGRATAILFSQEGAKIVVIGRRQEKGEKTVDLVRDKGGQAIYKNPPEYPATWGGDEWRAGFKGMQSP